MGFLALAVVLWMRMPDHYPVHFRLSGEPTRWTEDGPGMWILLVALCAISFGKLHPFQRFLFQDPDSTLLNVPYERHFQKLPTSRKVPVARRVNRMSHSLLAVVLFMLVFPLAELVALRRMVRRKLEEEGLLPNP